MAQHSPNSNYLRKMISESPVRYGHIAGLTLGLTYIVMLLGAYTSAIGAGLSCPDWPTCYGTWVPFLQPDIIANSPYSALQIFAEWAHRGLAMTAGLFIAGTAVGAWIVYSDDPLVKWSATTALVLLPFQVVLGGLTVTGNLKPIIVTTHLGVATLILLSLLTTVLTAYLRNRRV
ncbi:heme A synthase [Halopenitus sp. H-Gu1]|uniref:COX15/CtaA family protein n=1 Tax=Halopenitus sp. H-Gu1 TaxID=3242697 RepID=UPI00359EF4A3